MQSVASLPISLASFQILPHLQFTTPKFPQGLPINILCSFLIHYMHATCSTNFILLDLIVQIIFDESYELGSPIPASGWALSLQPKHYPQYPVIRNYLHFMLCTQHLETLNEFRGEKNHGTVLQLTVSRRNGYILPSFEWGNQRFFHVFHACHIPCQSHHSVALYCPPSCSFLSLTWRLSRQHLVLILHAFTGRPENKLHTLT